MNQIAISYRGISWRTKMIFIAACYAAVLGFAVLAIVGRHYAALRNPNDFNGGMAAAGDWFLDLFIAAALLVPTFLLALVVRERETASLAFAKALFGFSVTAPLSFALLSIPAISQTDNILGWPCMYRMLASPLILAGLATSRLLARYPRAKQLLSWALACEAFALASSIVTLFFH